MRCEKGPRVNAADFLEIVGETEGRFHRPLSVTLLTAPTAYRLCRPRPSSASVRAFSFCPEARLCRFLAAGEQLLFGLRADALRAELIPVLESSARRVPLAVGAFLRGECAASPHSGLAAQLERSTAPLGSWVARHLTAHVSVFLFALRMDALRGAEQPVRLSRAQLAPRFALAVLTAEFLAFPHLGREG